MLTLCICIDKEKDIDMIRRLAGVFSKEHPEHPLRIYCYRDPCMLIEDIRKQGGYDIYILDIIMPHMNGMNLAEQIRGRGGNGQIIFLSASKDYAADAFDVMASGYLMKPVQKDKFDSAMLLCIDRMNTEESRYFMLKVKGGIRRIRVNELMEIESFNHTRILKLSNGTTVETNATLSQLFETLKEYGCFYLPHRAYIVNLDYVHVLSTREISMADGEKVPVSRGRYKNIKEVYLAYMAGKDFK